MNAFSVTTAPISMNAQKNHFSKPIEERHYQLGTLWKESIARFYGRDASFVRKNVYPRLYDYLVEKYDYTLTIKEFKQKQKFIRMEVYAFIEMEKLFAWEIGQLEKHEEAVRRKRRGEGEKN